MRQDGVIRLPDLPALAFAPDTDLIFDYDPPLPGHANGLVIAAIDVEGTERLSRIYYAIGGGFVRTAGELQAERANESVTRGAALDAGIDAIWAAMDGCISRGLTQQGILPGGLAVNLPEC